jgi:hypothetical protein
MRVSAFSIVALLMLLAILACGDGESRVPYGLDQRPQQRFLLEGASEIVVDGQVVTVERLMEFRLEGSPSEEGGETEVELFLEHFFQRIEGGAEAGSELAISAEGVLSRSGQAGEVRLEPSAATPSAPSLSALLGRSFAGCSLDGAGVVQGTPWKSIDPLLDSVDALDWWLLGAPLLPDGDQAAWSGSRQVPRLGRYRLGIQLPQRYERVAGSEGRPHIQVSGFAQRSDLTVAEDFSGSVELTLRGEAELGQLGELRLLSYELVFGFDAASGSQIRSTHRVRISCPDCR